MRVGVIGDTHEPFCKDGYAEWCRYIFDCWEIEYVIHAGDLLDYHGASFHDSEPQLKDAYNEHLDAKEALQKWYELFPQLTLVEGNHDIIPNRLLKKIGLDPQTFLKEMGDIYDFPPDWEVCESLIMDNVLYHHGHTATGVNGFLKDAKDRMMNTVTGHVHSNAGIAAFACEDRLVWGMAVGSGVDQKHLSMAYGKHFRAKPIVSCGVVIDGHPYIEYMDLGRKK